MVVIFHSFKNFKHGIFTLCLLINLIAWIGLFLFRIFSTFLLERAAVPLISFTNITNIIIKHPFVATGLVIEFIVFLLLTFWLATIAIIGFKMLLTESFNWDTLFQKSLEVLGRYHLLGGIITGVYLLGFLPFLHFLFKTPWLSNLTLTSMVTEFVSKNPFSLVGGQLLYICLLYFLIRFYLVLPLMVLENEGILSSLKISWQTTSTKNFWKKFWLALIKVFLITWSGYLVILLLQVIADWILPTYNLLAINYALFSLWGIVSLGISITLTYTEVQITNPRGTFLLEFLLIAITFTLSFATGKVLFNHPINPVTIAHRGVNQKNGVPNTLESLKKTIKYHPDYIEMDVHMTKDNKFIVLHDNNLKKLAGIKAHPEDLTLAELKKLNVTANNHQTKLTDFDTYLKYANQHHQKLLIELKTTPNNATDFANIFAKRYYANIIENHHQLHTLDFQTLMILQNDIPKGNLNYLMPYNLTIPEENIHAYGMRYSTLSPDFVAINRQKHKLVYTWTPNSRLAINEALSLGVYGIVTDNVSQLHVAIKEAQHWSDAERLLQVLLYS
ncbi:glycerophosphodiester phosphodiesterase [Ligilactobacillus salivarius]|uniref:glycerophosphodiester phosphodiesterase n=1 Tax=Ligilactobacillus salivarius TaxID=1624 RepID=UPI0022E928E6|nr:glycerophosphodiester phosphodiesterase [Ligilactobacillus salivarius]